MLIAFGCCLACIALTLYVTQALEVSGGTPTGRCARCSYDCSTLPPESVCPECGSAERELEGQERRLVPDPTLRARWAAMLLPWVALIILAYPLSYHWLILCYQMDGFTAELAARVIPKREFQRDIPERVITCLLLLPAALTLLVRIRSTTLRVLLTIAAYTASVVYAALYLYFAQR